MVLLSRLLRNDTRRYEETSKDGFENVGREFHLTIDGSKFRSDAYS